MSISIPLLNISAHLGDKKITKSLPFLSFFINILLGPVLRLGVTIQTNRFTKNLMHTRSSKIK